MAEESYYRSRVNVVAQIPQIDVSHTSYSQFRDKFMRPNLPVLITGLMQDWRACKDWVTDRHSPNLAFISTHFGKSNVQVAECSTRDFNDQKRLDMTVSEFIAYWQQLVADPQRDSSASLLYLKDWHFVKEYPEYCPYTMPEFFMDDWLNFYLEHHKLHLAEEGVETEGCCSDYRFVYMGPKGTWTPLHADVFRSYSWSSNICGRKLWHLLPPSETHFLYDRHMRSTVYDIYGEVPFNEFPNFHKANWQECLQDRGQILFVPSGWYHQVTNLEDTISINHNWFNACNLDWVLRLLLADYAETKASIEDIRSISDDFEELCQRNLAANSGMSLRDFYIFMSRMTGFYFAFLKCTMDERSSWRVLKKPCLQYTEMESCVNNVLSHLLFNLDSLGSVVEALSSTDVFNQDEADSENLDRQNKEEYLVDCWEGVSQHSEYVTFLIEISGQYVTDMKHEIAENIMSGHSGQLQCKSRYAKRLQGENEAAFVPRSTFDEYSCYDVTWNCLAYSLNRNCYEDLVRSFARSFLNDETFIKVNTPRRLVLVIRGASNYIGQCIPSWFVS